MDRLLTRSGHDFYVVASLLQKSIRRGDFKRAGYAARELYDNYASYLWNRLLIMTAEDCRALITQEIIALRQADEWINKNKKVGEKNKIFVGKAIAILLEAYKGREGDFVADNLMREINPEMRNDPAFNVQWDSLSIDQVEVKGELFPDYVYDPHTLQGKKMGRNFKNYDFDHIETKDMKPVPRQASIFDGQELIYDDMYNKYGELTKPGYEIELKKFGEK